jgi:hypothetical protein
MLGVDDGSPSQRAAQEASCAQAGEGAGSRFVDLHRGGVYFLSTMRGRILYVTFTINVPIALNFHDDRYFKDPIVFEMWYAETTKKARYIF